MGFGRRLGWVVVRLARHLAIVVDSEAAGFGKPSVSDDGARKRKEGKERERENELFLHGTHVGRELGLGVDLALARLERVLLE